MIIKLEQKDFDDIIDLWEGSVQASHHFLSQEDIEYYKPLIRNHYLPMMTLYGIKSNKGELLAFMGTLGIKMEMLFVKRDHFGQKMGKKLLDFAKNTLKITKVDVNEQNPNAVNFYLHMGFKVIGRSDKDAQGRPFPVVHLSL